MPRTLQGILAVLGRVLLCTIFFTAAVGNKIPNFQAVAGYMAKEGVPAPQVMLAGAIVFLIVGSISIVLGYKARIGAFLLLVFLVLATYFFHDFWTFSDPQARQEQMIQFMKNLGLMGAMLIVIANGTGPLAWTGGRRGLEESPPGESHPGGVGPRPRGGVGERRLVQSTSRATGGEGTSVRLS